MTLYVKLFRDTTLYPLRNAYAIKPDPDPPHVFPLDIFLTAACTEEDSRPSILIRSVLATTLAFWLSLHDIVAVLLIFPTVLPNPDCDADRLFEK